MKKHEGHTRTFDILSQSWIGDPSITPEQKEKGVDRILVGFTAPDGGTSGQFQIVWELVGDSLYSKIISFDDTWSTLSQFSDVIEKLAELEGATPSVGAVERVLKDCGVVDITERPSLYSGTVDTTEAPDAVTVQAEVARVYLVALNALRVAGRKACGNDTWAADVEFGTPLASPAGIAVELFQEMLTMASTVAVLLQKLAKNIAKMNNPQVREQHKDLLEMASRRTGR